MLNVELKKLDNLMFHSMSLVEKWQIYYKNISKNISKKLLKRFQKNYFIFKLPMAAYQSIPKINFDFS